MSDHTGAIVCYALALAIPLVIAIGHARDVIRARRWGE